MPHVPLADVGGLVAGLDLGIDQIVDELFNNERVASPDDGAEEQLNHNASLAKILDSELGDNREAVAVLERASRLDITAELREQVSEAMNGITHAEPVGAGI